MIKVKSIPSSVFQIVRNFVFKLYSSDVQKSSASLPKAKPAQKETSSKPPTPLVNKATLGAEKGSRLSSKKVNGGESSGAKRGGGCKKEGSGVPKGKKGKMCDKPKPPLQPPSKSDPPGGNFVEDKCEMFETHKPNAKKWRSLSYALVPLALGLSAYVLATRDGHLEPDYIPYEYMYRRTKRFAWRDGRTSLFHGPNNLIPDVEEDRIAKENVANPAQEEE